MTWIDDAWGFMKDAPVSFIVGALIGFVLSNRYRVIRRDRRDDGREGQR
jgi:hypothetical protein